MPLHVSYMGTKRNIASHVANVIAKSSPGPLLDLFSGVCAVASAVGPSRQIWCNDIQRFASTVAEAFFTSPVSPYSSDKSADIIDERFQENYYALQHRFSKDLSSERIALLSSDVNRIQSLENCIRNIATSAELADERKSLESQTSIFPYRLSTITFAGGYLGLEQSVELDSIRYAIDSLLTEEQIDCHQHRWMILALCQASSKVATTTGHFAQYLQAKADNLKRFTAQRHRSIRTEWLKAMHEFSPIGDCTWRSQNRVFSKNANDLLIELQDFGERPAVIYADPPYTGDQYSRYYHLYESLLKYDYPTSSGKGRYRPDRFRSQYSLKSQVKEALRSLVENCAKLGSTLVLSYPENALIPDSTNYIVALFEKYFERKCSVLSLDHYHSSLGASKGQQKCQVTELIFTAG